MNNVCHSDAVAREQNRQSQLRMWTLYLEKAFMRIIGSTTQDCALDPGQAANACNHALQELGSLILSFPEMTRLARSIPRAQQLRLEPLIRLRNSTCASQAHLT